jgi:hypothetical protein
VWLATQFKLTGLLAHQTAWQLAVQWDGIFQETPVLPAVLSVEMKLSVVMETHQLHASLGLLLMEMFARFAAQSISRPSTAPQQLFTLPALLMHSFKEPSALFAQPSIVPGLRVQIIPTLLHAHLILITLAVHNAFNAAL